MRPIDLHCVRISIDTRELSCILPPLVRNQKFADDIVIDYSDADAAVVFFRLTTSLTCLDEWLGDIWPSPECIEDG